MEALTHKSDIARANTARTMSQQHALHKSSSVYLSFSSQTSSPLFDVATRATSNYGFNVEYFWASTLSSSQLTEQYAVLSGVVPMVKYCEQNSQRSQRAKLLLQSYAMLVPLSLRNEGYIEIASSERLTCSD